MPERYTEHTRLLIDGVLNSPGETQPQFRHAVEAQAAGLSGRPNSQTSSLPEALERYTTKVAQRAYAVTEEDIKALKDAGYSENAIFELTVSAALGAGMARLEIGLSALKGGDHATQLP